MERTPQAPLRIKAIRFASGKDTLGNEHNFQSAMLRDMAYPYLGTTMSDPFGENEAWLIYSTELDTVYDIAFDIGITIIDEDTHTSPVECDLNDAAVAAGVDPDDFILLVHDARPTDLPRLDNLAVRTEAIEIFLRAGLDRPLFIYGTYHDDGTLLIDNSASNGHWYLVFGLEGWKTEVFAAANYRAAILAALKYIIDWPDRT